VADGNWQFVCLDVPDWPADGREISVSVVIRYRPAGEDYEVVQSSRTATLMAWASDWGTLREDLIASRPPKGRKRKDDSEVS